MIVLESDDYEQSDEYLARQWFGMGGWVDHEPLPSGRPTPVPSKCPPPVITCPTNMRNSVKRGYRKKAIPLVPVVQSREERIHTEARRIYEMEKRDTEIREAQYIERQEILKEVERLRILDRDALVASRAEREQSRLLALEKTIASQISMIGSRPPLVAGTRIKLLVSTPDGWIGNGVVYLDQRHSTAKIYFTRDNDPCVCICDWYDALVLNASVRS